MRLILALNQLTSKQVRLLCAPKIPCLVNLGFWWVQLGTWWIWSEYGEVSNFDKNCHFHHLGFPLPRRKMRNPQQRSKVYFPYSNRQSWDIHHFPTNLCRSWKLPIFAAWILIFGDERKQTNDVFSDLWFVPNLEMVEASQMLFIYVHLR